MKTNNQSERKQSLLMLKLLLLILLFTSATQIFAQTSQTPTQSVCPGNEPYLVTATPGSTYNWSITPGAPGTEWAITGTGNSIAVDWNIQGVYVLSVAETNAENCPGEIRSVTVTVTQTSVPTITPTIDPVCTGTAGVVYSTESGMSNYSWVINGGLVTSGGTVADNSVTVTWNGTGPYSVSVNYTNAGGCPAGTPTIRNITVTPAPVTSPIFHN
jgi:hypothetical protein